MHLRSLFTLLPIFLHLVTAANILFAPGHMSASHAKGMYPLAETLARHGHDVTMLQIAKFEQHTAKASAKSKTQDRYLMLPVTPEEESQPLRMPKSVMWSDPVIGGIGFILPWKMCTEACKAVLDNPDLKEQFYAIIRERKWDLVFVDDIFAPCGMLAAEDAKSRSNASIIDFGTSLLIPQSQEVRGLFINKALYPSVLKPHGGFYNHRSFQTRLHNAIDYAGFYIVGTALDHLVPYWLGLARTPYTSPSLFSLNSDLLMASLSPMLEFTKPMAKDVVELDVDCPTPTPLPENYQKFVDSPSSKGTIVFAMGHTADWDDVPEGALESFSEAFAKLSDYRIVWQFVTRKRKPTTPSHLMLDKWVPQSALLYHPKTKVFISHVGGKSLREAICAGIPIVTMPMFAEQYRNAAIAHKKNISVFLDKLTLSPDSVYAAVREILNNTKYERNVQMLNEQLEDRLMKPMESGAFWAEFLARHRSTTLEKYLRMHGPKLSYLEYASLDVTFLVASVIWLFLRMTS